MNGLKNEVWFSPMRGCQQRSKLATLHIGLVILDKGEMDIRVKWSMAVGFSAFGLYIAQCFMSKRSELVKWPNIVVKLEKPKTETRYPGNRGNMIWAEVIQFMLVKNEELETSNDLFWVQSWPSTSKAISRLFSVFAVNQNGKLELCEKIGSN